MLHVIRVDFLHTFTSSQPYLYAGTMLSMLHVIRVDFPAHVHKFTTIPNLYAGTMLAINAVYKGLHALTCSQSPAVACSQCR